MKKKIYNLHQFIVVSDCVSAIEAKYRTKFSLASSIIITQDSERFNTNMSFCPSDMFSRIMKQGKKLALFKSFFL